MSKVITSLFIYKSQLYSSYLDGNIIQQTIETMYKHDGMEFNLNYHFEDTIILDIKAYKDKLYILTTDGLYTYYASNVEKIKSINNAQVITIDTKLNILFIISDTRGLIGINLRNNKYIDDINILFSSNDNNQQIPITSVVSHNGIIFLSILNRGIIRVDYKKKKSEFVYKKMQKIELKNPQDIYFNEKDNELAIVDFDYGLILIQIEDGETTQYQLPNNDIPNSIKMIKIFDRKLYIVQARNALYIFDIKYKEFKKIFNNRVSNLTTYYNKIYFTHKGELHTKSV